MQLKYFDIEVNIWKTIDIQSGESLISNGDGTFTSFNQQRPYKVYSVLLSQTGTNPPEVIEILENTLGEITYGFEDDGNYNIFSDGLFTENKTTITVGTQNNSGYNISFLTGYGNSNQLYLLCYNGGTPSNNVIDNIFLEIRVYYSEPA